MTLDDLNNCTSPDFVGALGGIFEHAPWVAEGAFAARPFASIAALHAAMWQVVSDAPKERQLAFLRGHPELAGGEARAGRMAADSVSEQSGAGLDRLSDEDFARFEVMNAAYRERFGLPFILCVKRHGRDSLLATFEQRLGSDAATERQTAEGEVRLITALRLAASVEGPAGGLRTHGELVAEIRDESTGHPIPGIPVELVEIVGGTRSLPVARGSSAADETTTRLISGRPVPIATYELRFELGDRPGLRGWSDALPPIVPVRFRISSPEARWTGQLRPGSDGYRAVITCEVL